MVVNFFSNMFTATSHTVEETLFRDFPSILGTMENTLLQQMPNEEEIWEVVRALNPDSVPGANGFMGWFYSGCWDIIKKEVVAAIQDFFKGQIIPRVLTPFH